ncbi:CAP domain-containing protein [Streptomyces phaeochromogenes]|uniref:CAP domain-containing protein n=1 Tax=Streptomyces phaeochromogenes TaxID=1923 RepID=A0ABZ1HWV1_STRPH|nr:CAP domain-containing protein [Streptomyces phaeochromogenes]WSD21979.1 CAP domain-containing protein [Streptomyces phaeochromogenes]
MSELVPGGNLPLPGGTLTLHVPGPFDVSALITDDSGKVRGDGDFVFYNQPTAPGARLHGETLTVDPPALRSGASRVTVVVSPAEPGTALGRLSAPTLRVTGPGGGVLARFTPPRPQQETVLLLAEIYRRGTTWKLRALGQGYADGLAGIARDFGVEVSEDADSGAGGGASPGGSGVPGSRGAGVATALNAARAGLGRLRGSGRTPAGSSGPSPAGSTSRPPAGNTGRTPAGNTAWNAASASAGGSSAAAPGVAGPASNQFLGLVNSARAAVGAPPVSLDARLTAAAHTHAAGMAARGSLGSEGADGLSVYQRLTASGYAYLTVGEHLVSGPLDAAGFVEYCLSSEQSRRTIHDPAFTEAGVAYVPDGRSGILYWTALWARPLTPAGLAQTAAEVVTLTNAERARAGLRPLAVDTLLTNAAQAHSADMVARAFYSHTSPDGSEPWHRAAAAGSTRRTIGENIACGQRSAAEVVQGWMDSPGHRANILKPAFTHIGVGFAGGGSAGTYWTQLFGA